jgi:hypothetical protein
MAKLSILAGSTSQSVTLFIQDSSSTTGAGLSGLVFNTSGLIAYYTFTGANATATAITLATLAAVNSAFSSGGFKEIDATNMKGVYRLDLPNTALATSKGRSVAVMLSGAANMAPCILEIELTGWDNQDGVHAGLTALPNAAAAASGGLPTIGATIPNATAGAAGGLFIAGTNAATTITTALTTTFTGNLTGSVGSVTGAVGSVTGAVGSVTGAVGSVIGNVGGNVVGSVASVTARVSANTDQLAGQTVTAAAGVTFPSSVASPTNITAGTITTVTNLTNAPTAGDLTATMKTSVENAVWDATQASHVTAGTTGKSLSTAGAAADPWATSLPGAYGAGTAGFLIGTNLDAKVTTRYPTSDAGASLTSIGDTRLGNLDATVTSRATSAQILTTALTESYAALHAAPTLAQAIFEMRAHHSEKSVSGTTVTLKGIDGSTSKATLTLDDGTAPTSITRAS